jgi:hypothetical protein
MGLFDKLKGAMNAVTGGAAKVFLEFQPQTGIPGQQVQVRVTTTSTGAEVKSGGIFIDLRATEHVHIRANSVPNVPNEVRVSMPAFERTFQIAPAFVLPAGQTMTFEGTFQVPHEGQPTYEGPHAQNEWQIRGRMEAFGNDPDSGFLPFAVGRVA